MTQVNIKNSDNGIIPIAGGRYLYLCDYNRLINAGVKSLFLKYQGDRKISIRDIDMNEAEIAKKVRKIPAIALEVTENCNLRCKYCIYSDFYENWRQASPRDMDFDTARKGLDYIYSLIKNRMSKEFALGFYGGEPLLKIGTIKEITAYGKKLFAGWRLRLNITTNLTLLDDDILDFLAANRFILLVSLDGPKENHDSKRVYAKGGGTFDIVYRNLERIAKRYPEYFEKIGFSAVYSPDLSLKKLYDFFTGSRELKDKRVRFSLVNPCDTGYYETYAPAWKQYRREFDYVLSRLMDKVRRGEELRGYDDFLFSDFTKVENYLNARSDTSLAGACRFDSRLFLDARGCFRVCERINSTFSLGDVEQGFDFKKMSTLAREFADFNKTHCRDCSVRFLCRRCYVQFAGKGEFRAEPKFCDSQKAVIVKNLERFVRAKEEGLI